MRRLGLLGLLLLTACAGTSEFDRCVAHSVQEGVRQDVAERACEQVVGRDG
ncbi:MAG TPA: hypothetical protein VM433_00695 [Mycobacteriales bacterium]|nr:hypothetical protein [Mycobacteriales bacterium]